MNIENSPIMSLFASSETANGLQQALLAEDGDSALFGQAFFQQLSQLQAQAAALSQAEIDNAKALKQDDGLLSLLQGASQLPINLSDDAMQNLAALIGKKLPIGKQDAKQIDLDETMQALGDVMAYIESINQPVVQQEHGQNVSDTEAMDSLLLASESSGHDKLVDHAENSEQGLALAIGGQIPVEQKLDLQPLQVITSPVQAMLAESANDAVDQSDSVRATDVNLPVLIGKKIGQSIQRDRESPAQGKAIEQNGDEFQALLIDNEAALRKPGLDNPALQAKIEEKTEVLLSQATNNDSDSTIDIAKPLPRVAAEIAQLNRAIVTEQKPEMPAMTRHLAEPHWDSELADKLVWMHKQAIPSAELRLNPQHLGPVAIKIDVNQDQTTVSFSTPHLIVKEAIEAAVPKLREMLGGQQLNLLDVNVSQQQSDQRQSREFMQMAGDQQRHQGGRGESENEYIVDANGIAIAEEIEAGRAIASNGLLSLFA